MPWESIKSESTTQPFRCHNIFKKAVFPLWPIIIVLTCHNSLTPPREWRTNEMHPWGVGSSGGGGGLGGVGDPCGSVRTAGLLGRSFWSIGTYCVNTLYLHIVLPLIHIRMFLTTGVQKTLHQTWS